MDRVYTQNLDPEIDDALLESFGSCLSKLNKLAVNVTDLTIMLTTINKNTDNVNKSNQGG